MEVAYSNASCLAVRVTVPLADGPAPVSPRGLSVTLMI